MPKRAVKTPKLDRIARLVERNRRAAQPKTPPVRDVSIEPLPIDKDMPLPPRPVRHSWKVGLAETVRRLEVGDSFVYSNPASAVVAARRVGMSIKLEARPIGDGRYRIWRTA